MQNIKIIIAILCISLSCISHAEQWIFLKQNTQNNIYVDIAKIRQIEIDHHPYKQAWIKMVAIQDDLENQRMKGDYTQTLWRFDCNNNTSRILNYVDYLKDGQIVDSGVIDTQTQVVFPNSIEENALLAICDGQYPKQNSQK